LVEAGARWGIDKAHRAEVLGTELAHETTLNTMAFAFERLVLGVAMQGEDDVLFQGSAPFDGVEGDLIELVGKGVHFWTTLQRWLRSLRTATTLEQWQGFCEAILESMTQAPEGQDWLHQQVRDAIATVVAQATEVGFDAKITLGTLKDLLTGRFDLQGSSQGPTAGAVTFCAMLPMRTIPHRVVVLLAVDDEIFPRRHTSLAFDRIATQRRPGDRDARDEDRALFLESLLAARDHLIITYTGRDPISNEPRPPAVPLSELMDAIDQSMVQEDALATEPPHKLVLREHPTQAFSPRNFGPDPKSARSYDRALARCLLVPPRETRVFRGAPLPEHPDQTIADSEVSLTALNRFLKNPSAIFLRDRLKVSLENRDAVLEDRETMSASSLLNWQIEDRLLNAYLETPDAAPQDERLSRAQAGLLASGDLPHGVAAQDAIINARQKALRVLQYVQSEVLTEPIEAGQSLNLKVQLGHTHIVGTLTHVYGEGQLMITCAKARPKRVLEAWLRHLALTLHDGGRSLSTTLIAYDKDDNPSSMRFPAVEANSHAIRAHLEAIVRLRTEGYRTPIPFFMDTSYAYYKSLCAQPDKPHKIALETMNKWNDGYQHAGEGADPYHRLLYAPRGPVEDSVPTGHDDVDAAFRALSETIWGPIAEALGGALP